MPRRGSLALSLSRSLALLSALVGEAPALYTDLTARANRWRGAVDPRIGRSARCDAVGLDANGSTQTGRGVRAANRRVDAAGAGHEVAGVAGGAGRRRGTTRDATARDTRVARHGAGMCARAKPARTGALTVDAE